MRKRQIWPRAIAALLSAAMVISAAPVTAMAETIAEASSETEETSDDVLQEKSSEPGSDESEGANDLYSSVDESRESGSGESAEDDAGNDTDEEIKAEQSEQDASSDDADAAESSVENDPEDKEADKQSLAGKDTEADAESTDDTATEGTDPADEEGTDKADEEAESGDLTADETENTVLLSTALGATADDTTTEEDGPVYVLMNIPYEEFYETEDSIDAITSATLAGKARNVNVNGASYHQSEEAVTEEGIIGMTYPVKVESLSVLADLGAEEVTDEDEISYEMNVRGTMTTFTLKGADALQESPTYSYYVLSEEPANYKELSVEGGEASFSEVVNEIETVEGTKGNITVGGRHADIEISLSGVNVTPANVSGVVITADDGQQYGLHHVVNIWRGTEIGWNLSDLDLGGKTITNIRYFEKDGTVTDYPVQIEIGSAGYVLMNIPYADFYAAELGSDDDEVDAVTSATKNKPRTGTLAGGSYHVNADGSDISGVIYPVFVEDMSLLEDYTKITDESVVDITVTNRGQQTTTTYEGKDALFEADDYAYYVLSEKPARYKTLSVTDGVLSFSAVSGRATTDADASATITANASHTYYEISVKSEYIKSGDTISAVVLTDGDGKKYGLRHIVNIWRGTELGFDDEEPYADLIGKTITNIRYITQEGVYDLNVNVTVPEKQAEWVLMNIPYAEFYKAELGSGDAQVDAVTSATKNKPRTGDLAGGSYHVNDDGSDISGVIYPVKVGKGFQLDPEKEITDESSVTITVTNRGKESTTEYKGSEALFEAPHYAWYALTEAPKYYKEVRVNHGTTSFGAVVGESETVEGVTDTTTINTHHCDIEIALTGTEGVAQGDAVSGVILSFDDDTKMGLRHIENVWRATAIGGSKEDLAGKTITNIRYIKQDGIYDYPVEIKVPAVCEAEVTAEFEDEASILLTGIPEDAEDVKAVVYATDADGNKTYLTPQSLNQRGALAADAKAVEDGKISIEAGSVEDADGNILANYGEPVDGTTYTVELTASNYFFDPVTVKYTEAQEEPKEDSKEEEKQEPAKQEEKQEEQETTPARKSSSGSGSSGGNSNSTARAIIYADGTVDGITGAAIPGDGSTPGTWESLADGNWRFYNEAGVPVSSSWVKAMYNGVSYWYYFNADGIMHTGWLDWNGGRYYLYPVSDGWKGRMVTGTQVIDGRTYVFDENSGATEGRMITQ